MSERRDAHLHFFAGWLGATISCVLLSPLEVLKTKQQSSAFRHLRAGQLTAQIWRAEGAAGFYRGLVPHLAGVGPARALYFGGYRWCKQHLPERTGLSGRSLDFIAGAAAMVASATIMSPLWVVKTRFQLQPSTPGSPPMFSGMADAFRQVYRREGLPAFYRGLSASYLGVAETALQFALYGELKERRIAARLATLRAEAAAGRGPPLPADPGERARLAYGDGSAFWTSAASKLVAAVATYPHEVLRTRMREGTFAPSGPGAAPAPPRYTGLRQSVALILREEGLRGLYGGMTVHLLRTVPNAAVLVLVVEKVTGGEV
jgi:solute carrier family 25 protein 33/36